MRHLLIRFLFAAAILGCGSKSPLEISPLPTEPASAGVKPALPAAELEVVDRGFHISAASNSFCVVQPSGQTRCWGDVTLAGPGDGSAAAYRDATTWHNFGLAPATVSNVNDARGVATSNIDNHACILSKSGLVACWGYSYHGMFAWGKDNLSAVPRMLAGVENVVQITSGEHHLCAVYANRRVGCWGGAYFWNVLGVRNVRDSSVPVDPGLADVRQLSARAYSTCAVTNGGSVYCWGLIPTGGDKVEGHDAPLSIAVANVVQVATGDRHWCALHSNGTVYCWGEGQPSLFNPTVIAHLEEVRHVAAGDEGAVCAVRSSGTVACWGGTFSTDSRVVEIDGVHDAVEVAVSFPLACALRASGKVTCWGASVAPYEVTGLP